METFTRGTKVVAADGSKGKLTGGERYCSMEGCRGMQLGVRWDDGKLTFPCTKGMIFKDGAWRLVSWDGKLVMNDKGEQEKI